MEGRAWNGCIIGDPSEAGNQLVFYNQVLMKSVSDVCIAEYTACMP